MADTTETRKAVEQQQRHTVSDKLWDRVVERAWDVVEDTNPLNPDEVKDLAEIVANYEDDQRYWLDGASPTKATKPQSPTVAYAGGALQHAMGLLLLLRLNDDQRVKEFRATVLNHELVLAHRLGEWLWEGHGTEIVGLRPYYAEAEDHAHAGKTLAVSTISAAIGLAVQRWSDTADPIEFQVETVGVAAGGVLDSLRLLSAEFARSLRIPTHQAARSILSNEPPVIPQSVVGHPSDAWPASVTLTVDANTTPQEVAVIYARARKRSGFAPVEARSTKVWNLLAFKLDRERRGFKDSWERLRVAWNEQVDEWELSARTLGEFDDDPHVRERLLSTADDMKSGGKRKLGWRYKKEGGRSQVFEAVRSSRLQVEAYLFG